MHLTAAIRSFSIVVALLVALSVGGFAQTQPDPGTVPSTLPTYVAAGAAFNQTASPRINFWGSAIYPVSSSAGFYTSSTVELFPVTKVINGKNTLTISTQARQGLHKVIYTTGNFTALLGGDVGAGFSQASPNGVNVNLSEGFTATLVYQLNKKWAVAVPIRGAHIADVGWAFAPAVGVVYKP